jgi:hypothetical protein
MSNSFEVMRAGVQQHAIPANSSRAALFRENAPVPVLQFSALFARAGTR